MKDQGNNKSQYHVISCKGELEVEAGKERKIEKKMLRGIFQRLKIAGSYLNLETHWN